MKSAAGIDVGHSAVKMSFTGTGGPEAIQFPSVVIPAFPITFDSQPEVTARDTIEVAGKRFFVGQTAVVQGANAASGLSMDWIVTPEHEVLMRRAQRYLDEAGVDPSMVVLGLPVAAFAKQHGELAHQAARIFKGDIAVVPQPWGAFQQCVLDEEGAVSVKDIGQQSWAVVDVGHFTSDFMLIDRGRWVEMSSGTCSGVSKAIEQLNKLLGARGYSTTHLECEEALRTGVIKNFNDTIPVRAEIEDAVAVVVTEIMETGVRLLGSKVRQLDRVLLAGGGAELLFPALKSLWPNTIRCDNPRGAIADGMRRWGIGRI